MESHYQRPLVVGCDKFISLDYCQCSAMFMCIDTLHSNSDLSVYRLKDMGYSTWFISWTTASLELDGCELNFSAVWWCAKVAGYTEGRCLVGGLINNVQALILAMRRAAHGDPSWFPCPVCHYADLEPSGQSLCRRRHLLWLCWGRQPQQLETPTFFFSQGFSGCTL